MGQRSSSEIHTGRAGLALGALAVASGAVLVLSPLVSIAIAPFAYMLTDLAAAAALGVDGPSIRVRVVARALASLAWGGAVSVIVATRGADLAGAAVRLPLLAIALAVGTIVGAYGSAGRAPREGAPARPPLTEGPLVALCDVLCAGWCFLNALAAHEADLRARALSMAAVAVAVALRALLVARLVARAGRDPERPGLAALGFVAWLALAAIACTVVATPITWSGLGAALVLTVGAALAEQRRRRPLVVFLRGSLAFAFAAMLGVATFLAS